MVAAFSIVCLVVDECHRAVGDAPVVKAVQHLRQNKVAFRILGLSATPGSSHEAIQVRARCRHYIQLNRLFATSLLACGFNSVNSLINIACSR